MFLSILTVASHCHLQGVRLSWRLIFLFGKSAKDDLLSLSDLHAHSLGSILNPPA